MYILLTRIIYAYKFIIKKGGQLLGKQRTVREVLKALKRRDLLNPLTMGTEQVIDGTYIKVTLVDSLI